MMRPKEAIVELWKENFFESYKSSSKIESKILKDYGVTTANITAVLNNCKDFLRREEKGWIQRTRYEGVEQNKRKSVDYFAILNIHPRIQKASEKLFLDGHYSQAILEAFKAVNNLVKEKSGQIDLDGSNLMSKVFSANKPILAINNNLTTSDKDEQLGFMYLFEGAMLGIRNPKAHDETVQKDSKLTLHYLTFASLLCKIIDNSKTNM